MANTRIVTGTMPQISVLPWERVYETTLGNGVVLRSPKCPDVQKKNAVYQQFEAITAERADRVREGYGVPDEAETLFHTVIRDYMAGIHEVWWTWYEVTL